MFAAEHFLTATLRAHPRGVAVARILAAAVNAVEPGEAIRRHVQRQGEKLLVCGRTYALPEYERVIIIAIGKAGLGMASALSQLLQDWPHSGLAATKHAQGDVPDMLVVIEGGHPVPNEKSLVAGQRVLQLAGSLTPRDLLFCLISGGGSALVTAPVAGVSLEDLQALTAALLACGARVDEINTLRRALDQVKGGGLARAANGAQVVSLILSDVVGSPLEAIASGPTAPNPTTPQDALAILEKYHLSGSVPVAILQALRHPPLPAPAFDFRRVQNEIVASNLLAAQAALAQAAEEGFTPHFLGADLQGEARDAALELVRNLRQAQPPACLVAGGETTVTLRGAGRGGRNMELTLAAAIALDGLPNTMLAALATDGEDGPTDAAGAVAVGESVARARSLGLEAVDFLQRNDSYTFFAALGDLFQPGSTGTNVNDLALCFVF